MKLFTNYDIIELHKPLEKKQNNLFEPHVTKVLTPVMSEGLCQSDLRIQTGYVNFAGEDKLAFSKRGAEMPMTFGNKLVGIVEAMGVEVNSVEFY